ncbi:MAG: alpha-amylase [Ignavibacteria bacterium]|jgi:glycosidase|nr:alpha-amylase [Ignavibacteria bacterium]MCU7504726.1 alpha-amylase [Ignavibacteria bacterium]MCU7516328.1 alpha-amylase [Ignavibacteria bacterium]
MPHWSFDSVFYHIYPLGLCGAPKNNDFTSQPVPRLGKIYGWIDHLKSLGVNAVYLGPLFESTSHGYDTSDYFHVDRRLGTDLELKNLVSELHRNGIRVILDGVFNHVGRNFWAFQDLQRNGKSSQYASWFYGLDFGKKSPYGDNFSYEGWNGHYNLVKLNLNNHQTREHLFDAVRMWMDYFEIDGLRLDAADCIDMRFLRDLNLVTKHKRNDFWLMGEIIHGDYRRWVNDEILDSVTNYECYKGLYSSLNDKNYFEIAYSLNRQFGTQGMYKSLPLYGFADNHDVNRIASVIKKTAHLYPLYCLLFTMPGVPSLYYGSEWAIKGEKLKTSDDPLRPSLNIADFTNGHSPDLAKALMRLSSLRHSSEALRRGDYTQLHVSMEQFAFMRRSGHEAAVIVLNSSEKAVSLEINMPSFSGAEFFDVLNEGESFKIKSGKLSIGTLYPSWARILMSRL